MTIHWKLSWSYTLFFQCAPFNYKHLHIATSGTYCHVWLDSNMEKDQIFSHGECLGILFFEAIISSKNFRIY